MKINFIEEIKRVVEESKTWVQLEVEYAKLTIAEKLTMLLTSLIIGFVCLLLSVVVLIILALAVSELYMMILVPSLAYLATAGSFLVLLLILFMARKQLIITPISRMITKVILGKNTHNP